jgi:NADP-dependent 3-hydroxy acid dehydrogenase YdfG
MSTTERKTWFITGTSGFGHAFATCALSKGCNVVVTAVAR